MAWAKPSIGAWLGCAFLAVLVALSVGMRYARQSTGQAVSLIGSVETQYEPVLRKSRELSESITAFQRVVMERSHAATIGDPATVAESATRITTAFDGYTLLATALPLSVPPDLQPRLLNFRSQGIALGELSRQRATEIQRSLAALDQLVARASRTGLGIESGDQVFARKSFAELSRAAATMRASARLLATLPTPATQQAALSDRAAFAALLHSHAAEFQLSPGRAWFELMREDLQSAARGQARFLQLDQDLDAMRDGFELEAQQLGMAVETGLQQPAWAALTAAAGRARQAAAATEQHLQQVTAGILCVVLLIGAMVMLGIAAPVRRLLEGTRHLARGTLEARVPRGGVRELDELAGAFNDMATALAASQQTLREHQVVLEERIARRTRDLHHLAHHDPLTDLPNRRELAARLASTIERSRAAASTCAVVYMDIDNFKTINDSLGHQFGDRVLREIGARLAQVAGHGGFLARLGGDEFTLVAESIKTAAAAEHHVGQIMRAFARPLRVGDRDLMVSLSAGIALYPQHGDSAEALLRAADSALYDAKERGRNGFQLYREELLAAASHRFTTEQALRRALENDEFLLYFQPEISLSDRRTTVVEALLRWRQPDGRIAPAGEFIDIAEKSGLILELSDWLLRRAVESARELRANGWPQARVAINVSAQQFLSGRFVEAVERTLREAQMSADCLEVELTESALQTGRLAVAALHELRRLGVAVALDDFGAGYSTLKSIEELPLTRVKLDRSLTKDLETNATAAAFALSCIRLCQGIGLAVTAEGIERPEQLDSLAHCGDVQVQGYLIARPAPLEEVMRFIPEAAARIAAVWPHAPQRRRDATPERDPAPVTFLRPRTG